MISTLKRYRFSSHSHSPLPIIFALTILSLCLFSAKRLTAAPQTLLEPESQAITERYTSEQKSQILSSSPGKHTWWLNTANIEPRNFKPDFQVLAGEYRERPGAGWKRVNIPGNLVKQGFVQNGKSVVWYLKTLAITKKTGRTLALRIGAINDRDRVYFNGVLIGATGDWNAERPVSYNKVRIYEIPHELIRTDAPNIILAQVKGYFSHEMGIFRDRVEIGFAEDIWREFYLENTGNLTFLLIYFSAGAYFLFLFLRRRKDREYLYFSLFILVVVLYQFLRTQFRFIFDWDFYTTKKVEFFLVFIMLPLGHIFLRSNFQLPEKPWAKWWDRIVLSVNSINFGIAFVVLFTSSVDLWVWMMFKVRNPSMIFYFLSIIGIISIALYRREKDAFILVGGVLIMSLTATLDVVSVTYSMNLPVLYGYGFFFMILSMVFLLANRFVSLHMNLSKTTEELRELKTKLEIKVQNRTEELEKAKESSDRLLLNILPNKIAEELKARGEVEPSNYPFVTVMFADIAGFTSLGARMTPDQLIRELDECFSLFDDVIYKNRLEKLKTIGDAYMCAGGLPIKNMTNPIDACMAALELLDCMETIRELKRSRGLGDWSIRIGIHTGPVTAGVIGKQKFAYDIWGDAVNIASRMETSGVSGRVNISERTYELVKRFFECEPRGAQEVKGRGQMNMFFLNGIHPELSMDRKRIVPGVEFKYLYAGLAEE